MKLRFPAIVLNFKSYGEALGRRGVDLAKKAERVSRETNVEVAVCPSFVDLEIVASSVSIPVLAQHCDPFEPGPYTGAVVAEMLKEKGVVGSLLNHSEKPMKLSDLVSVLSRLRKEGLVSVVCADDIGSAIATAALRPDVLAIEPPELIGTGISVSKAKPEVVAGTVEKVKAVNRDVHILCGAGISSPEDVMRAVQLGTEGVLLSSAFVKSKDPEKILRSMCEALAYLKP